MVDKLQEMEVKLDPILQLFELPDVAGEMKKDDSNIFEYLTKNHKVCIIIYNTFVNPRYFYCHCFLVHRGNGRLDLHHSQVQV